MSDTPRPVQAAPDWPPVRIPGRPGWWRHYIDGQQVDLPTRQPQQQEGGEPWESDSSSKSSTTGTTWG